MIVEDYKILSIEPTEPPDGMEGTDWHCYVIEQGKNRIHGYQQGKIKAVTRAVEAIVVQLNERRYGNKRRVHLTMSSSAKKTAKK